eukprot:739304-Rhodomonas_salina.1
MAAIAPTSGRIASINDSIASINGSIVAINGSFVNGRIASIKGSIVSIHGSIVSINGRIAPINGSRPAPTLRVWTRQLAGGYTILSWPHDMRYARVSTPYARISTPYAHASTRMREEFKSENPRPWYKVYWQGSFWKLISRCRFADTAAMEYIRRIHRGYTA